MSFWEPNNYDAYTHDQLQNMGIEKDGVYLQ